MLDWRYSAKLSLKVPEKGLVAHSRHRQNRRQIVNHYIRMSAALRSPAPIQVRKFLRSEPCPQLPGQIPYKRYAQFI